jgi:hypothetical protein
MRLIDTNDILRVNVTVAPSSALTAVVEYDDFTTTARTTGIQTTSISAASTTTILASPAGSTTREVSQVTIFNPNTTYQHFSVEFFDNTNAWTCWHGNIPPGSTLFYSKTNGWSMTNTNGLPISSEGCATLYSSVFSPYAFMASSITATKTITSTNTFAVYIGRASFDITSLTLRYRVTTLLGATISWAEAAIATGAIVANGNPSLTTRGYTDVSGVVNSTGLKSTTVTTTGITAGMDLWALFGCSTSGAAMVLRAMTVTDAAQTGVQASAVARPSTMASPTSFTLEGNTALAVWCVAVL